MEEQGRRVTDRLYVPGKFSERFVCCSYCPYAQRQQRHHRQAVTRTKLAVLKNGKGSERGNKGGRQIDLSRPRLQGYLLEPGERKATTDKGNYTYGGVKPT